MLVATEFEGIVKSFGRFRALDGVSASFASGRVHALVGANGAGKSTFIKVVGGVHTPEAGTVRRGGRVLTLSSPAEAERLGIRVVHQETQLFPDLSVAENVTAGGDVGRRLAGITVRSRRGAERITGELLERLGISIDPRARMDGLSLAEKKLVQIARALHGEPQLLLLDEPTAALEAAQSERVVGLVRSLADRGLQVVFVSHKLDEVLSCSDDVTVLRHGQVIARLRKEDPDLTIGRLAELVAGRRLDDRAPRTGPGPASDTPVLEWSNDPGGRLEIGEGHVVTFAGLLGSGASRAAREVALADESTATTVTMRGHRLRGGRARAARRGVGFVPQERKRDGILPELSIERNIALSSLHAVSRFGVLDRRAMRAQARKLIEQLDIRPTDPAAKAGTLSGGNQQKVLLARWLAAGASVLVVEEPTHGVDVGAKAHVNDALRRFADGGGAVVVSALESDEFVEIADRYLVFRRGRIVLETQAPVRLAAVWNAALGEVRPPGTH